jgi:MFS family permease
MKNSYQRVKSACYFTNISMSIVGNLSPLLFLTFRSMYGISYSLLGLLVLINFSTQLVVDLILSLFSYRFDLNKLVRLTPVLTVLGLGIYAVWPWVFAESVYLGLAVGTVVFSASSGLSEVLISPVIAAIPAENPEREMSKLHSVYAWGVVGVVLMTTLFLFAFGQPSWQILALLLTIVPMVAAILFAGAEIPAMESPEKISGVMSFLRKPALWLSVFAIFLGGAAECTMAQWCSGYLELSLGIPKLWGDVFGVALFSLMLGLGRTLYAKYGKNVHSVLLLGAIGATVCYLLAAFSPWAAVGLLACALTGFCVSMLWPGNLVVAVEKFPSAGVFVYAMMAAGGDFGASVGPQLVGLVTDFAIVSPRILSIAARLGMTGDQLGMKLGMIIGAFFPMVGIAVYAMLLQKHRKGSAKE